MPAKSVDDDDDAVAGSWTTHKKIVRSVNDCKTLQNTEGKIKENFINIFCGSPLFIHFILLFLTKR